MALRNENIEQPTDINGRQIEVLRPKPESTQVITTGNQTTEFTEPCVVRVILENTGYIKFGTNPTAADTDTMLIGESTEYFKVNATDKISVSGTTMHLDVME